MGDGSWAPIAILGIYGLIGVLSGEPPVRQKQAYEGTYIIEGKEWEAYKHPERTVFFHQASISSYQLIDEGNDGTLDKAKEPVGGMCGPRAIIMSRERPITDKHRRTFSKLQKKLGESRK